MAIDVLVRCELNRGASENAKRELGSFRGYRDHGAHEQLE